MEEDISDIKPSFSRAQKWSIGIHVFLSVAALLAVVVMLNYLAHRHNQRIYLSNASQHKLTPLTLQVLDSLTNQVKIIAFYDRREPLFGAVSGLLKEYRDRSPKVDLEFVDYRMPGRAEAIRNQYRITSGGESSRVIFDSGTAVRTVMGSELSDFGVSTNNEIRRTGFKGEQMFTSALLNLSQSKPSIAYFTQGHGEHDPSQESDRSYTRFARLLENNNFQIKALNKLIGGEVPSDCGLLIIAGPEHPFDPREIAHIEKYAAQGGRLLILFNASTLNRATGLEAMLYKWNVEVGFNWVQDAEQAQSGETAVIVTSNYGVHPMVRPLLQSSLKLVTPRSISQRQGPVGSADAPKVVEVVLTGSSGVAKIPTERNQWKIQRTGNIPLVATVERGGIAGVTAEKASVRMVVAGDSLFLSNLAFNQAANSDFANLIVNWLVNRDSVLNEIGPKPVNEYQILLTAKQMAQVQWLFLGAIPGSVIVFGFFVWLRRRV